VHDESLGRGALLIRDVVEKMRADFRRRPGAKRLADGHDVVVDRLRQPHHSEIVTVGAEIGGEVGSGGVGVVAADRMEDGDAVFGQLLGRDPERVLPFLDQPALDAVGGVCELDAAVADGRATVAVQQICSLAHLRRDDDRVTEQDALVAGPVGDQLDVGSHVAISPDQTADRGREAGSEPTGGEQSGFLFGHRSSSRRDPFAGAWMEQRIALVK
jgi:hypothetical protein